MTMIIKSATVLLVGIVAPAVLIHSFCRSVEEAHQSSVVTVSPCQEWEKAVSNLTPDKKEALKRDGAVYTPTNLLLSEDLVADCNLRGEMSEYFAREFSAMSKGNEADRMFAAKHSKEIVAVIRALWPSLSKSKALVLGDGFSSVKYEMLGDPALKKSDIAPLISDILRAETIGNEMARILFLRPMPATIPALLDLQKTAERVNDKPWQILNLALLQKMGNASALPKLRKLLRDKHLPDVERRCVTTLIAKAERGEEILFSDIENLEYEGTIPKP